MASKRCFCMDVVDSDAFLDMPLSTQCLYFHLGMRADDYGFVNNPRRIARLVGASDDDFKLLVTKRFLLLFENGVVVIKHWRMHNNLRSDRAKIPQYPDIAARIYIKENGSYTDTARDNLPSLADALRGYLQAADIPMSYQCHTNDIPMTDNCHTNDGVKENKIKENKINIKEEKRKENKIISPSSSARETRESEKIKFFDGTTGLCLSEEQNLDLMQRLSPGEYINYTRKLDKFKQEHPERRGCGDYRLILKWAEEDRKTEGQKNEP